MSDKLLERYLLDRFISTLDFSVSGEIIPGEQPDFVIKSDASSIGVEVTRYFIQTERDSRPIQEQESLRSKVLDMASREFDFRDKRLVHVNVLFNFVNPLLKSNLQTLSENIALIVCNLDVPIGEFETVKSSWRSPFQLPKEVISITVARSSNLSQSYWFANDVGFVPECEVNEIQSILNSKESKVKQYRISCSEVWLLIAVDGFGLSSYADFPQSLLDTRYASSFDRIFLFINQLSRSWELKHL